MMRRRLLVALGFCCSVSGVAGVVGLGGCTKAVPVESPLTTLRRYQQALERDEPDAAYALLAPSLLQGLSREQFAAAWKETKVERQAQAQRLAEVLGPSVPGVSGQAPARLRQPAALSTRALLTLPQGTQLALVPQQTTATAVASGWRVIDPDLQVVRGQTPEDVLRLILRAAEQRSFPAILRLLTVSERQALEAELRERIERLRSTLSRGQPVEVVGDRARLQYDPRFFIELRKEGEGWRVADFN